MANQASMESFSVQTQPTTNFERSFDNNTSIDSSEVPSTFPTIRLRIFCNASSKNSSENGILLHEASQLRKEISFEQPSAIYLNAENSKTKVINLRCLNDLKDKEKALKGYKMLGIIEQYYSSSKKACFDIQIPPEIVFSEQREIFKGTFVNLREKGVNRYQLKSDDVIKLGRQFFRVTIVQDKICPNFRWLKTLKEQNQNLHGACRVCLCSDQEPNDAIISPCACSGSCGYIHIECLRKWLQTKMILYSNEKVIAYNLNVFQCEVCKTDLPKFLKIGEQLIQLFPLSIQYSSFVMLERLSDKNSIAFVVPFKEGSSFSVSIGRNQFNDLILNDMSISRKHAILHIYKGGSVQLSDFNSKFGTFVELQRKIQNCKQASLMSDRFTFTFDVSQE